MNGGVPGDPLIYYDTLDFNGDTINLGGIFYCTACHPYTCSPYYNGCSCQRMVTDYSDPRTGCQCTVGSWGGYDTLTKYSPYKSVDTLTGNIIPMEQWQSEDKSLLVDNYSAKCIFTKIPNYIPNPGGKGPFWHPPLGFKQGDFTDK